MSNILVVGGAGFVGRPLVRKLAEMEHKVSVIDNESVTPAEKPNGYTAYYKRDVRSVLQKGC
jgi:nucleoside-diphosphate-sugar epimerase